MKDPTGGPADAIARNLVGRLKHPWLFAILAVLLAVDLLVPDPVPFVDELLLALLTVLVGSWRARRRAGPPEVEVSRPDSVDRSNPPALRG